MNKHTKDIIGVSSSVLVVTKDCKIVANCMPTGIEEFDVPFEEVCANAILFAAAPKLLEACKCAMADLQGGIELLDGDVPDCWYTTIEECIAAIAESEKTSD